MTVSKVECQVIVCGNGTFGIAVSNQGTPYRVYKYLTTDQEKIKQLSDMINRQDVSVLHIDDIIEDFL